MDSWIYFKLLTVTYEGIKFPWKTCDWEFFLSKGGIPMVDRVQSINFCVICEDFIFWFDTE